jgi:hypothetical protein
MSQITTQLRTPALALTSKQLHSNHRLPFVCVLVCGGLLLVLSLNGLAGGVVPGPNPTQSRGKASPSPTPSPNRFGDLLAKALAKSREEQEKTLDQHGPQFSGSFDSNHFSLTAFCKGGQLITVDYEVEDGAEATLGATTLSAKGFNTFEHHLEGTVVDQGELGLVKRDSFRLPDNFGSEPQPSILLVHAQIGKQRARFKLHAMGVGVQPNLTKPPRRKKPPVTTSSSYQTVGYSFLDGFARVGVGLPQGVLGDITVLPDIINTGNKQAADYLFTVNADFQSWAADFRAITIKVKDGHETLKTKWVRTDQFNEALTQSSEVRKQWDGLNSKHRPSLGKHQLMIRAWWSKANGGAACVQVADQVITVQ